MINPVAQTFFINSDEYPKGVFISSIDLFFKKRDELTFMPFTLQLRPTVNGYPHSNIIYPSGQLVYDYSKINVSIAPSMSFLSDYTRFAFKVPVFLYPGEHAIVLSSNSDQYELFVAELGKEYGDNSERLISQQPYSGSFFRSQNGSTYTAYQNMDLMFRINRLEFNTNETSINFNVIPKANTIYADTINIGAKNILFDDSKIDFSYKSTSNNTGLLSEFKNIETQENINLREKIKINSNTSFVINAVIQNNDSKVSPFIDREQLHLIAVENIIDDAGIKSKNFDIINKGSGYSANFPLIIESNSGTGANVWANVASGNVIGVIVYNEGNDYLDSITANTSLGSGNNATISVNNETSSKGGNCISKYITRRVTLNDGFDATNLRVNIDAVNYPETEITVYYKVLSAEDPTSFDDRPYVKMISVQNGNESLLNLNRSKHDNDFYEFLYIPETTDCSYVGFNDVTYSDFKTFAIKIVMTSSNSTIVPRIKNFRSFALNN